MENLLQRFNFISAFTKTILYSLGAYIGENRIDEVKSLWIDGYGDFSEAFNAFRRINEPYFNNYFQKYVTTTFHDSLYLKTQYILGDDSSSLDTFQLAMLLLIIGALIHLTVDFILSLRYMFRVEKEVGKKMMEFILVDQNDAQSIMLVVNNFSINILSYLKPEAGMAQKIPI
jgi:hypothetical protein